MFTLSTFRTLSRIGIGLWFALATFGSTHALAAQATALVVEDAWIKAPPPGAPTTAAYMTLKNPGKTTIKVRAAKIAAAGKTEMHETKTSAQGMSRMHRVAELSIEPGATVSLAPGGLHIMAFDMKSPLTVGQETELTLTLASGEEMRVPLKARKP